MQIPSNISIKWFQNIPVGDQLDHVGYNISKHGLVALTRYFGYLEAVSLIDSSFHSDFDLIKVVDFTLDIWMSKFHKVGFQ